MPRGIRLGLEFVEFRLPHLLVIRRELSFQLVEPMLVADDSVLLPIANRFLLWAGQPCDNLAGFNRVAFADLQIYDASGNLRRDVHGISVDAAAHEKGAFWLSASVAPDQD